MKFNLSKWIFSIATLVVCESTLFQGQLNANWQPVVTVSSSGEDVFTPDGPDLYVNELGNAVSVWTQSDLNNIIRASSYDRATNTWSTPVNISSTEINPSTGNQYYSQQADPDVALNDSGYAVAVWEGYYYLQEGPTFIGDFGVIISATRDANGVWSNVQIVNDIDPTADIIAKDGSVALNNNGLAVAVWTQTNEDTLISATFASFLPQGGSWSTPVQISDNEAGGRPEGGPHVAINNNGDVVVVWKQYYSGLAYGVVAATYDASSNTWSGPVQLNPSAKIEYLPEVAIDPNGNAVAIWVRYDNLVDPLSDVVASYFTKGSGWGASTVLYRSLLGSNEAFVVLDRFGNATAVFDATDNNYQVYSSNRPFNGTWTMPTQISTGGGNVLYSQNMQKSLAVNDTGDVIAIWYGGETEPEYQLISAARLYGQNWQTPESISFEIDANATNIGLASCGFAVAMWMDNSQELNTVEAAINGNILIPSGIEGKRCCEKFVTQKRCTNILYFPPNPCIIAYRIYRDNELIGTTSKCPWKFVDPLCTRRGLETYSITSVNIYGYESQPVIFQMPQF